MPSRLRFRKRLYCVKTRAINTFENAMFSLQVLQQKGIKVKKVILVCKAHHSRQALLTYQTVFPKDTIFYVSSVTDKLGITKENWFQDEARIHRVMSEVRKIGTYFGEHIPLLTKRF